MKLAVYFHGIYICIFLSLTSICLRNLKKTMNHIAIQKPTTETIYKNQHVIWNTVHLNVGVKNQIIISDNNQLTNVSIGINRQNILGLNTAQSQGTRGNGSSTCYIHVPAPNTYERKNTLGLFVRRAVYFLVNSLNTQKIKLYCSNLINIPGFYLQEKKP